MTAEATEQRHHVTAGPDDRGRIDAFLAGRIPSLSRSRIKALITGGAVSAEGGTILDPSQAVKPGHAYSVAVPAAVPATPRGQEIALTVLYEDAALIVIDKPAGLVVHPAAGNPDNTLVNALIHHCGESLSGIGGVKRPGIVHRLDKDTSGVMVAAKTDTAHADLVAQFQARSIERAYAALVWGVPSPARGRITGNIGRSPRNRKKMAVLRRGGRTAATNYRVVRAFGDRAAQLECRLESGRTHQIRVHLAHIGHPVIGDPVYGGRGRRTGPLGPLPHQALHAFLLGFRHPETGEDLRFTAPFPPYFNELIQKLEAL
jgi:23S rRNA pseudouridine1911/1915/1917 synthase